MLMVASLIANNNNIRLRDSNLFDVLRFLSLFAINELFPFLSDGALCLPPPPTIASHIFPYVCLFCLFWAQNKGGGGGVTLLQKLTFKAAVSSILPLVSVTTTAWDFFFSFYFLLELIEVIWPALPIWMSHRLSGKLLDFTLQLPPTGPCHYKLKRGWTVSHEGNHTEKWHPLSAMREPAASTCCCSSINQWL